MCLSTHNLSICVVLQHHTFVCPPIIFLSVICLSINLTYLSVYMSVHPSISLCCIHQSHKFVCLHVCPSILQFQLFVLCLSIMSMHHPHTSVCLCFVGPFINLINLSTCLSIHQPHTFVCPSIIIPSVLRLSIHHPHTSVCLCVCPLSCPSSLTSLCPNQHNN